MNKNKYNIALIGAGQLGSRHLQGLVNAALPASIYVIDPSAESLTLARQRAEEVEQSTDFPKEITYNQSFTELPADLDLAVIATSSLVRLQALTDLMKYSKVENLILEKILFTSEDEFTKARELIGSIPTWVNCTRRLNGFYQDLYKSLKTTEAPLKCVITGRGFGLACNSIHFIDIFSMLSQEVEYEFDYSNLIPKVFDSKRPGYIELFGRIICKFAGGHSLEIDCLPLLNDKPDYYVRFEGDEFCVIVDEIKTNVEKVLDPNAMFGDLKFNRVFLSTATGKIVEDILINGDCGLTKFDDSVKLHIPFIKGLGKFVEEISDSPFEKLNIT